MNRQRYLRVVRTAVLILLGFFILMDQTELSQLLKVRVLAEHFNEHRQAEPGMDFLEFLSAHYLNQKADDDLTRDQELPFKAHHACRDLSVNPPTAAMEAVFTIILAPVTRSYAPALVCSPLTQPPSSIFQPPKQG